MFWNKNSKSFFDYFEEHARELQISSQLLKKLFSNVESRTEISKQIKAAERRADEITHLVIKQMDTTSFILPLDREDILNYIETLDDVLDFINMTSQAFVNIYDLSESSSHAEKFSTIICNAIDIIVAICPMLRYPSKYDKEILQYCVELHRLENEGDDLQREALRGLFAALSSQEISVPKYIAWNDIYRTLEFVTDKAEDCANIAEQIVLKYS